MNNKIMMEYILFAVVTVLVGLVVCEIICCYRPELERYHTGDNKNVCIVVLAITGLVLRYLLTTKMGEKNLLSEPGLKLKKEIEKIRKEDALKIADAVKKLETIKPAK